MLSRASVVMLYPGTVDTPSHSRLKDTGDYEKAKQILYLGNPREDWKS